MRRVRIPGCEYASCVAIALASQVVGISRIYGVPESIAVFDIITALNALGVRIVRERTYCVVEGLGVGGFSKPKSEVHVGSDPFVACIILALLSVHPFSTFLVRGSCRNEIHRPYAESSDIIEVMQMLLGVGARFVHNGTLPTLVLGCEDGMPFVNTAIISSNAVKAAILTSCINILGKNQLSFQNTLDTYTEFFLKSLNTDISVESRHGIEVITVCGQAELFAKDIHVSPGASDVLCAIVDALVRGLSILIYEVLVDSLVRNALDLFRAMGGDIEVITNAGALCEIRVNASTLCGVDINCEEIYHIAKILPFIFVVSTKVKGSTKVIGLSKSGDKWVDIMIKTFIECGVVLKMEEVDTVAIHGSDQGLNEIQLRKLLAAAKLPFAR